MQLWGCLAAGLLTPFILVQPRYASFCLLAIIGLTLSLPAIRNTPKLLLALAAGAWSLSAVQQQQQAWHNHAMPHKAQVVGEVVSLPIVRGRSVEFLFRLESNAPSNEQVRVRWYQPEITPREGERWLLPLNFRPARSRVNFSGNGGEPGFFARRVVALASVAKGHSQRLGGSDKFSPLKLRGSKSDWLADVLDGHPSLGTIATLGLADRRYLSAFRVCISAWQAPWAGSWAGSHW